MRTRSASLVCSLPVRQSADPHFTHALAQRSIHLALAADRPVCPVTYKNTVELPILILHLNYQQITERETGDTIHYNVIQIQHFCTLSSKMSKTSAPGCQLALAP